MWFLSHPSLCQQTDPKGVTGDTIKTSVLEELVVSVNKWEQNVMEVPGTVSRTSQQLIQFQNPQTSADLLTLNGKVFVQKSQLGGGSPIVRGFATNRVLLVVDGVRMNNAIFRGGNVQNVISLDAHAIESNEVVFGPGSVIYGSDAIGGVMDFHTLSAKYSSEQDRSQFAVNAMTRHSSANTEKTGHIDFNIGLKNWAFKSSITYSSYQDLKMGSRGPDDYLRPQFVVRENGTDVVKNNPDPELQKFTGYDQINLMQKVNFRVSTALEFAYNFHYSKTTDYARYDRLIRMRENGELRSAEWYYGPQKWIMHSLRVRYYGNNLLFAHVAATFAYQDYEESRHDRNLNSDIRTNQMERVHALSANFDFDKKLNESVSLFYGGEIVWNRVGSVAYTTDIANAENSPAATRYPDGSTWSSYAGYLGTKIRLNDRWMTTISNRFTSVITKASFDTTYFKFPFTGSTLRNRAVNSSLGLVFTPTPKWKFFSNFSTGFRAPNVDDIGKVFDSGDGNVIVPNPDLEPEYAYNAEIGVASQVSSRFYFEISGYYTTINNAIARGYSTFNGQDSIVYNGEPGRVLSQQNISEVYVYGTQLAIEWQLSKTLRLKSDYNIQTGRELDTETGRNFSPTHVPPTFGSTHLIFSRDKFTADLYAIYNGVISHTDLALTERADAHLYAKDNDGNPYSPSWSTFNLKLSYKYQFLTIHAGAENLFDVRYRPYSSGITAPGRNFIMAVRATL